MKEHVTIKSSKYGLEVHLDPEITFSELLDEVESKFSIASKFFANSSLAISFDDRVLSKDEEQELIHIITDIAHISIVCIIDNNHTTSQVYRRIVEQSYEASQKEDGQFYKGTLKRRQVLESESSIIVLGDVEQGAKVISKGNIVVMGSLNGIAHAGASGDTSAFVSALQMNPKILKIADLTVRRRKLPVPEKDFTEPKIAIIDGEHIYIDPLI
ncbi:MAG: septum site-determining protein MinC [Eubacteriales bacterium]